ncbi:nucleoside triphosphate pyrophosphohydrolase [Acidicapsa acidisoli]|uniref:nucleoside triphosphate pyrophosphohydrolase n=1 Tax=Acidicapsa acidisoli TaxID=1615681 RepID=UPI0021E03E46|nr:nucleoside triphosphate pyrophosphohydrolase [Acidicapsa acidisoli]
MEPLPSDILPDEIPPASALDSATPEAAGAFAESVAIMARLRGPDGCPWDREQSFDSIRKYTLEETYEVLDAIERRDWPNLAEELGDLLLQVLFYSQMAADEGRFTIADVLGTLNRKLVRRHPHVFGEEASAAAGNQASVDAAVNGSAARVLANWEQIKTAEKQSAGAKTERHSLLDEVQRAQPALAEAAKLGSKAAKVGFDWSHWRDLLAKLDEETAELVAAVEARETVQQRIPFGNDGQERQVHAEVEAELGDLLFTAVNLGRHLKVDAEMALRGTNARFRQRFREMERVAGESLGKPLSDLTPTELEALWMGAKVTLSAAGSKTISISGAGK